MSAVDVLAEMDHEINHYAMRGGAERVAALTKARAAVAELMKKTEQAESRLTLLIDADKHKLLDVVARDELRAALARCKGER